MVTKSEASPDSVIKQQFDTLTVDKKGTPKESLTRCGEPPQSAKTHLAYR